jgi:hypothetical protein
MENLVEYLIGSLFRSSQFYQRQRQPFAKDWNVSGPEERQRVRFHLPHIFLD